MEPDRDDWFINRWPTDARVRRGLALLGFVVRRRRLHHGLSQAHLGRLCGLDQSVISRLENGKLYGLRWHKFARIIDALDGLEPERSDAMRPWPGRPPR